MFVTTYKELNGGKKRVDLIRRQLFKVNGYIVRTFARNEDKGKGQYEYFWNTLQDWAKQTGAKVEHIKFDNSCPWNKVDYIKITDPLMGLLEEAGLK